MGAGGSREDLLRREEVAELEEMSGFTGDQILDLYSRFRKLDRAGTGTIMRGDLLSIPELSMNPLVERVVAHFGFQESSRINFTDFIKLLSVFNESQETERLRVIFSIFDCDQDQFISAKELKEVLKSMVGVNMTEEELETVVDKLIRQVDSTNTRKISWTDFESAFGGKNGIASCLAVRSWGHHTDVDL